MAREHPKVAEQSPPSPARPSSPGGPPASPEARKVPGRFATRIRRTSDDNYRGSHGPVDGKGANGG
jgi:hypothetical protein